MKKKINIKVIADVICPWCFIGCNHLNKSIVERKEIDFEIDWQTYYLNPSMPHLGIDRKKYIKNKFGEQSNAIESQLVTIANNYKIKINLDKIKTTPNTRKIHQIINFLKNENLNKSYDLAYRFMSDYFINGIDLRNEEYIFNTFSNYTSSFDIHSLNKSKYIEAFQPLVNFDFMSGVPIFIFNDKWTLHGAQSPKILETAIDIAAKD